MVSADKIKPVEPYIHCLVFDLDKLCKDGVTLGRNERRTYGTYIADHLDTPTRRGTALMAV